MKDALVQSLEEIKTGIGGMVQKQDQIEVRLKDLETKGRTRFGGVSLPGVLDEKKSFSFAKAILCISYQTKGQTGIWDEVGAGFEKEVLTQATKKALDTGTASPSGGYVVPVEYSSDIIQLLRAKAAVIRAGATVLDNLSGSPVQIPKQLTAGSVYWLGQNATLTASDATFGQVQLTPKIMGMRCQYSNLLNILSNPAIEDLIRNDMARVAALEVDRVALRGSGASNQPLGILNTSSIGSLAIGTNGGTYDLDFAAQALAALDTANALGEKVAFVTHPKVSWKMKRQRIPQFSGDSGGAYVVPPIISDSQLSAMLGYPMFTTTQLPTNLTKGSSSDCSEVYLGDFSQLLIGLWGNLELLATNVGGNAWAQNAIEVRMIQNVDIQLRHAESFVVTADARTN